MHGFIEYEWKVTLRDDIHAFNKRLTVRAPNYDDAITRAFRELRNSGIDDGDYVVTRVSRGNATGYEVCP